MGVAVACIASVEEVWVIGDDPPGESEIGVAISELVDDLRGDWSDALGPVVFYES
ncbi:MAG TPA: hypothetical protein VJB64_00195 [Patescibacteria group bacterium]|nr:hypothetical protein [Patescibacteria group bacterium]